MNRGGKGRGRVFNRRIYYQLCGKPDHFVDKCYHCFDKNFQRQVPNQGFTRANDGNQYNNRAYMASFSDSKGAYMSETSSMLGSYDGNNPRFSTSDSFVAQSSFLDFSWFVDFGATNHITLNLSNLSLRTPYNGGDKVVIGNDKQLPITHVDTSRLFTNLKPTLVLSIPNVLHVPSMKKNLHSVS